MTWPRDREQLKTKEVDRPPCPFYLEREGKEERGAYVRKSQTQSTKPRGGVAARFLDARTRLFISFPCSENLRNAQHTQRASGLEFQPLLEPTRAPGPDLRTLPLIYVAKERVNYARHM